MRNQTLLDRAMEKHANIFFKFEDMIQQVTKKPMQLDFSAPPKKFPVEVTQQVFYFLLDHPHRIQNGFDILMVNDLTEDEKDQIREHAKVVVRELRGRGIQSVHLSQVEEMLYREYKKEAY